MSSERKEFELDACLEALIDYRGKSPPKSQTGVPVISAKVVKDGRILEPVEQTIAPDYYSVWMRRGLPKPGDIVMTTEAPLGEVAQLDDKTAQYALGQRIVTMRGRKGRLHNKYFRYLLLSHEMQDRLQRYATGTTVTGISQKALRSVLLPLPDIDEQRSIAKILGDLDDKTDLLWKMNCTLEGITLAVFKAWFVDFEPVRAKAIGATSFRGMPQRLFDALPDNLENSEIGKIPTGWEVGRIHDMVKVVRNSVKPLDNPDQLFQHFSLPAYDKNQEPNLERGSSIKSGKFVVPEGAVLFSKLNPRIPRIWLPDVDSKEYPQVASTEFLVCVPKRSWPRSYVYNLISQAKFVEDLTKHATGTSTSHQRIRPTQFEEAAISMPPYDFRQAFDDAYGSILERVLLNRRQRTNIAAIRDALLPRLISGELEAPSLKELDIETVTDGG